MTEHNLDNAQENAADDLFPPASELSDAFTAVMYGGISLYSSYEGQKATITLQPSEALQLLDFMESHRADIQDAVSYELPDGRRQSQPFFVRPEGSGPEPIPRNPDADLL